VTFLGLPSLEVESGGTTKEGQPKRHLYWKLKEAAGGADLATTVRLRLAIAAKVGADPSFQKPAQPIRVPGSIYFKGALEKLVTVREHRPLEYELRDLVELVAGMPAMPGLEKSAKAAGTKKPIGELLTLRVREGGVDGINRHEALGKVIGHWVFLARIKKVTREEAWERVLSHNFALIDPPPSEDELRKQFESIEARDAKNHEGKLQKGAGGATIEFPGGDGSKIDPDQINKTIERGGNPELPNDGRPLVHLSAVLDADLRKCERALILSPHVDVYQRAGCIVRRGTTKGKNHEGKAVTFDRIARHNVHSLRAVMAQAITFLAPGKMASPCHPPKEYARLLLDHPEKDYPILRGLIRRRLCVPMVLSLISQDTTSRPGSSLIPRAESSVRSQRTRRRMMRSRPLKSCSNLSPNSRLSMRRQNPCNWRAC
jgi:hypothetical protein